MLTLLLRKMRNTKWMVLCLLIGFIMAAAMTHRAALRLG